MDAVKLVLLFSGKRKCGKDFISGKLLKSLGDENAQIIRISAPLKTEWAKRFNLDLNELLGEGPYKEKHRKEMIEWSDTVRAEDYGFFCREAIKEANRRVLVVSDIRRKTDVKFFKETFGEKVRIIRINCSEQGRSRRGWVFQEGIDDVQSECDLDDFDCWDLQLDNDITDVNTLIGTIVENTNYWLNDGRNN